MKGMSGRMMYLIILLIMVLLVWALFYLAGNNLLKRLFFGGLG